MFELIVLFLVAWVISPIVLIPMLIRAHRKKEDYERFVNQLYLSQRISSRERDTLWCSLKQSNNPQADANAEAAQPFNYVPQRPHADLTKNPAQGGFAPQGAQNVSQAENTASAEQQNASLNANAGVQSVQGGFTPQGGAQNVSQAGNTASAEQQNASLDANAGVQSVQGGFTPQGAQNASQAENSANNKKYFESKNEAKSFTSYQPVKQQTPVSKDTDNSRITQKAEPKFMFSSPKKEKKHYDSATILFGIGVVFVILAGFIFATAFWVQWSDLARTGAILVASVFFFGISYLSKKKFKLESTSGSMYVIGSVFTALTIVTAGYLEIFGESFSIAGDLKWLFFTMGVLTLTGCAAAAEKIYKKTGCRYITVFSLFIAATLLSGQFAEFTAHPAEVFALMATVLAAIGSTVYEIAKKKNIEMTKPVKYAFLTFRAIYALAGGTLLIHEFFHSEKWSIWSWAICLTIICECFMHIFMSKNKKWFDVECVLTAAAAWQLSFVLNDTRAYIFIVTGFAIAGTAIYNYLEANDKLMFDAKLEKYALRILFAMYTLPCLLEDLSEWTATEWTLCAVWAVEMLAYGIMKKSNWRLIMQGLFIEIGVIELLCTETIPQKNIALGLTIFAVAAGAAYNVIRACKKEYFNARFAYLSMRVIFTVTALYVIEPFLPLTHTGWAVCGILCAEALAYAIIYKSSPELLWHGSLGVYMLYMAYDADWLGDYFTLCVGLFAAVAYAVYYILKKFDKTRFTPNYTIYVLRCLLGLFTVSELAASFGNWSALNWVIFALLAFELTVYAVLEKNELILIMQCIFIVAGNLELYSSARPDIFVFISWVCIASGTFIYTMLKKKGKLTYEPDLTVMGMRAVYAAMAIPLWAFCNKNGVTGWAVGAVLLTAAELGYYGIAFKNKVMVFMNTVFTVITCIGCCIMIHDNFAAVDVVTAQFIFSAMLVLIILLHRSFKSLSTKASDILLLGLMFITSLMLLDDSTIPYGVISMLAFEAFILIFAFSDNHFLRKPLRFVLALPVLITCQYLCSEIENSIESMNDMISTYCSLIFTGAVILFSCAAFALSFGIKHDETKYSVMKYGFEIFGILAVFSAISWIPYDIRNSAVLSACVIVIASIVILYAVMQTGKNNILSIVPLALLYASVYKTAELFSPEYLTTGNITLPISIGLCAVFMIVSRVRSSQGMKIVTEDGKKIYDTAAFAPLFSTLLCRESLMFGIRAVWFIILLEVSAFLANLYRTNKTPKANRTALTLSAATVGLALAVRPFMVFENTIWTSKIIIGIIVLFGISVGYIWRDEKKFASRSVQSIFMVAYILLLIDALMNQTIANTIIVLCVSAALMLFAFKKRTKRWFLISAIGLAGLTLYVTKDFFESLSWWLYLLIVGILLIAIASANEYLKGKGKNLKQMADSYIDTWKW